QAKAMLDALRWDPGTRRTRRWVTEPGNATDFRTTIRKNMRYGGEPLTISTKARKQTRRPLVLLCDISGSMERYSRMLLHFMHGLAEGVDEVDAFVFAVRLTRITRAL